MRNMLLLFSYLLCVMAVLPTIPYWNRPWDPPIFYQYGVMPTILEGCRVHRMKATSRALHGPSTPPSRLKIPRVCVEFNSKSPVQQIDLVLFYLDFS